MYDSYFDPIPSISRYMNIRHPRLNATNKQMADYRRRRTEALESYVAALSLSKFPGNIELWKERLQKETNEALRYGQLAIWDELEFLRTGKRPQTTHERLRDPKNIPTEYLKQEAKFYDNIGEHNVARRFRQELIKRKNSDDLDF